VVQTPATHAAPSAQGRSAAHSIAPADEAGASTDEQAVNAATATTAIATLPSAPHPRILVAKL
jgi:hypothetical protein